MNKSYLHYIILYCFLLCSCSGNLSSKEKAADERAAVEVNESVEAEEAIPVDELMADADSVWSLPPYTAELLNAIKYFRANNKYKDLDKSQAKQVVIDAVIMKDGSPRDIKVRKYREHDTALNTWGEWQAVPDNEYTREAIRLVQEGKIEAGRDESGNFVNSKWGIIIFFPPQ